MESYPLLQAGGANELFDHLLRDSSSVFGRLLRGATLGGEQDSLQCQAAHLKIFRLWLDLPLREQRADLRRYLFRAEAAGMLPQARQHCDSPSVLVPESASAYERELFLRDLQLVSASMANDGCALNLVAPKGGAWAALWQWKPKWRASGQELH